MDELETAIRRYVRQASGPQPGPGAPRASRDPRFELLRSVGEECQEEEELARLLQRKQSFILYDGFEPSGRMHIAQGVFKALNVNKCTQAGGTFIFWVADWFGLMNDKMGGDLAKIRMVGEYFIEVWKATGMDMSQVQFRWSSEEIPARAAEYWSQAFDIARRSTLSRVKKCCTALGRADEETLTAAQILYPIMQSTDVFFLRADVCQLGVDQRKVNMLARDYCAASGRKEKPIILSHHMVYGLKAGQAKMSKSDPDSAIFMEDSPEDVERKIRGAHCPVVPSAASGHDADTHLVEDELKNPCLDYVQHILFSQAGFVFRSGDRVYSTHGEVREALVSGALGEAALKDVLIEEINQLLVPVRRHFAEDPKARSLLATITQWKRDEVSEPQPAPPPARFALPRRGERLFVLVAPLPATTISFQLFRSVLRGLRRAPAGYKTVLWFPDWSASAWSCLGGDLRHIEAFYTLLLHCLSSAGGCCDLMSQVEVLWQSRVILESPSEYWISVINVGRRCSLDAIRHALPSGVPLTSASQVFAVLMHVGDALALADAECLEFCCPASHENTLRLAQLQFAELGMRAPEVSVAAEPNLRLTAEGTGVECKVNILMTDSMTDVIAKVKRCFAEPRRTDFCPLLAVANELVSPGRIVVGEKDEGCATIYESAEVIEKEYASGALHPTELKPGVTGALNLLLEGVRAGREDATLNKAMEVLEACLAAEQNPPGRRKAKK